ncbi:hypothetical protein DCAR_0312256 [Daucus carota subsp. sativus]|uniref:TF-B3 domain-containing protein n=1 Tax=Daucus carota subsp. sativus TaxID=79200 RepID=A0AAF0WR72_DAUCS|nr:hypothetical protein DCAR_0312256 [Daucus carota subsp. sativus]
MRIFCYRKSSACSIGETRMEKSMGELDFICRTTDSTNLLGILDIPASIAVSVAKFMTGVVGLHLPNGDVWRVRYNREFRRIEGLQAVMKQYNVSCYHMLSFKYYGGTEFGLQIFNQYAIETHYSTPPENVDKDVVALNDSSSHFDTMLELSEYEKDKLHACWFLNAYTTFTAEYIFVITDEHLQPTEWTLFNGYFTAAGNLLYGLKNLMTTYGVKEEYVMFFEFVGISFFYVTIYNEEGEEIFNKLAEKLMLRTLVEGIKVPENIVHEPDVTARADNEDFHARERKRKRREAVDLTSFLVTLLKSHVDQHGHGMYLPRYLIPIFRSWNKSTEIKLVMKGKTWTVAVLRRNKTCRFGVGWNLFTLQNKLRVGEKLILSTWKKTPLK